MMVDLPSMQAQATSVTAAPVAAAPVASAADASASVASVPATDDSASLFEPPSPSDARIVEALDRLADRLHAIESRLAHLEKRQVEDELFGFSGAVAEEGGAPVTPDPPVASGSAAASRAGVPSTSSPDPSSAGRSDLGSPLPAVEAVPQPARLGS
jgi:hypothetical protein